MNPLEAVQSCLSKYVVFQGRASRAEFWWFFIFESIVSIVLFLIGSIIFGAGYCVF